MIKFTAMENEDLINELSTIKIKIEEIESLKNNNAIKLDKHQLEFLDGLLYTYLTKWYLITNNIDIEKLI